MAAITFWQPFPKSGDRIHISPHECPGMPFVSDLSHLFRLPHLPSLAGEQRSNRTVVLERYGQKPVHDPGSSPICFLRPMGATPDFKSAEALAE